MKVWVGILIAIVSRFASGVFFRSLFFFIHFVGIPKILL